MAFKPLLSLVDAAAIPAGQVGSLFKLPYDADVSNALSADVGAIGWLLPPPPPPPNPDAPPPPPPPPTLIDVATAFNASIVAYSTAKMARINTELPIMNAAAAAEKQIAETDALIDGTLSDAERVTDSIGEAFRTSTSPCTDLAGPNGPFGALLGAGQKLSEAAAAVSDGITGALDDIGTAAVKSLSELLVDPPNLATTGAELMAQLKTATSDKLSALRDALYPEDGSPGELDDIAEALSDAADKIKDGYVEAGVFVKGIAEIASDFNELVSTELASFNTMLNRLTSINLVNLLNSTNPCINAIMGQTVTPGIVDPSTMAILGSQSSFNIPVKTAIAGAAGRQRLAPISTEVVKAPLPPFQPTGVVDPDLYTAAELDMRKAQLAIVYEQPAKTAQIASAQELTAIEQWKVDNRYVAKRDEAGANAANPNGTSKDPAVLSAWMQVHRQYTDMVESYNNTELVDLNAKVTRYQDAQREYGYRAAFGRFPYAKMNSLGMSFPPDKQTTYLE